MPKITLSKNITVTDKERNSIGFSVGENEVTQEQEKLIKEQFPHAIVTGKEAAKTQSKAGGE